MANNFNSSLFEKEDKGHACALFEQIETLFGVDSNHFFKHVLNERLAQISEQDSSLRYKNIATKLQSPYYFVNVNYPLKDEPQQWHDFEQRALNLFDNWAQAWCAFNIWKIKSKYQNQPRRLELDSLPKLTQNEEDFVDSVIDNIENHAELYYTLHSGYAMELPDAVMLINLATFVSEQQWFEMLYEIEVSAHGSHFILAQLVPDLSFPVIVSTAKVNHHKEADNWLYFSPFFQTSCWTLLNQVEMQRQLVNLDLLCSDIEISDTSSAKFENALWQNIAVQEKCCEIVRLTVSGNQSQKIFILYLSQKRLMAQLEKLCFQVAFVVIEQPLMIQYYQSLTNGAYLKMSYCHVSDSGFATYKGLWFIKPLSQALSECSYRNYKVSTITQLKQHRHQGQELQYA
ncbi:acyl-homoserine-lactone synthase [Vibrio europaeus]|uniref:acyl-homoserine-lactone synthase n=1 Tax=Vibrio europaeus TaxID=300876 RepID=UPI002341694A|nr:acyl-homoserine-lactone synthase [Vibrio europaeus]MDC5849068.1 acyl-homoserine-lactone synthase [Vibrio europaeus]